MSSKKPNNYSVNFESNDDNPYLIPSSTAVHVEPIESRNSRSTRSYQSVKSTVRYSYNELCRESFSILYFPIIVLISITIWIIKLTTASVISTPLAIGLAIFIALNLSSALGIILIHHTNNNNTNNNNDTNTQQPTRIESILKNNIHILEIIYITMGVLSSCLLYISSSIITKDNNYITYDSSSYSDLIFLTISPLIYFLVSATPYLIPVLIAWCMSFATAMGALPYNDDRVFIIFTMLFILFTILYVYQQKQSYYTIINMLQTQAQQSQTPQPQQCSIHGSNNGTRSRLPGNRLIGQNSGRNIPGSALSGDGDGEGRDYDSIIGDTGTMYIDTNNNNINNNHTNDEEDGSDIQQQQHNNKTQSDLLKQIISNISHDMISPLQALEMGLETMYMTLIERLNRPGSLKNSRLMPLKFPLSNKSANDNNYNYNNISSNSNLYASNKSGLSTPSYKEHVRDMYWDPSMSQKQQSQPQQQVYTLHTPHTPLSSSANNHLSSSKNQQQLNSSKNQRGGFNLSLDTNLLLKENNITTTTTNTNNNTNPPSPTHLDNSGYYYGNNTDTFSPIGASSAARNAGYGMSSLYESQQLEIVQTMRSTLSFMAMIIDRSLDASKCTGGVQLLPNVEMFDAKESISKVCTL